MSISCLTLDTSRFETWMKILAIKDAKLYWL
jgi:hypothetical protein